MDTAKWSGPSGSIPRAQILNVPLPTSPHNHGDVVLIDGAADGFRIVDGRRYPVFNALGLLVRSSMKKYVIELATADEQVVNVLVECAEERRHPPKYAETAGQERESCTEQPSQ